MLPGKEFRFLFFFLEEISVISMLAEATENQQQDYFFPCELCFCQDADKQQRLALRVIWKHMGKTNKSNQAKDLNNTERNTNYQQQSDKIHNVSGGYNPYLQVHNATVQFSSVAVLSIPVCSLQHFCQSTNQNSTVTLRLNLHSAFFVIQFQLIVLNRM